jgi:hypothetical protein
MGLMRSSFTPHTRRDHRDGLAKALLRLNVLAYVQYRALSILIYDDWSREMECLLFDRRG